MKTSLTAGRALTVAIVTATLGLAACSSDGDNSGGATAGPTTATTTTAPADASAPQAVRDWVRWGAGPRAGQALLLGAKATALLDGRPAPSLEDVTAVALPVLRHRVLVNYQAEADRIDPDHVVARLLEAVRP